MVDKIEDLMKKIMCELETSTESSDVMCYAKVVDMFHHLAEAKYYCAITDAMEDSEYGEDYDVAGPRRYYPRPRDSKGRFRKVRYWDGDKIPYNTYHYYDDMNVADYRRYPATYYRDMDRDMGRMYYTEPGMTTSHDIGGNARDYREGRNGMSRRHYMEVKEKNKGNSAQEKLEKQQAMDKWLKDLGTDLTEMLDGATAEEKTTIKTHLSKLQSMV